MIRAKLSGNRSLVAGKCPGRVVLRIPEFIFQKKKQESWNSRSGCDDQDQLRFLLKAVAKQRALTRGHSRAGPVQILFFPPYQ
jgi:hypothetical protein